MNATLETLTHGTHTREELLTQIQEESKTLSAVNAKKLFCDNPGTRAVLDRAFDGSSQSIGTYSHNPADALNTLQEEGRVLSPTNHAELVSAIANARPDQIVVVPHRYHNGQLAIPNMGPRFLKRGHSLTLRRKNDERLDDKLADAIRTVTLSSDIAGYDWQGITHTNRSYKRVALVDVVRGVILDRATKHLAIDARMYAGGKPLQTGAKAGVVQIPSFTNPNIQYQIGFAGLPVYHGTRTDTAAYGGFDTTLLTNVPRELWDSVKFIREQAGRSKPREGQEQPWDHHAILAYERLISTLEKQKGTNTHKKPKDREPEWNLLRPYLLPSADTLRFYWGTQNHVLLQRPNENKKSGWDYTPPNIGQTEFILWKRVGYINERNGNKH